MSPDISEFSYGYAVTEELIHRSGLTITAAPLFPSLLAEGRSGGGYDVHLPFAGFPLFLQFKLSHCMVKSTAEECQKGLFKPNFYRMHLRPLKHSQQHNLLLDLEASGYPVYYVAPHFHLPEELNDAYINSQVVNRSVFFKPSSIGSLPDEDEHHVSFCAGQPAYLFSEPRFLRDESKSRKELDDDLRNGFSRYRKIDGSLDSMYRFYNDLFSCIKRRIPDGWAESVLSSENKEMPDPRQKIGYVIRAFFGCDAILVRPKIKDEKN